MKTNLTNARSYLYRQPSSLLIHSPNIRKSFGLLVQSSQEKKPFWELSIIILFGPLSPQLIPFEEEGLRVEAVEAAKLKSVDRLASIASCFKLKDPNANPTSMSNVGEALTVARRVDAMSDTDAVVLW